MKSLDILLLALLIKLVFALPPNYDDIDDSQQEPQGAVVNIDQNEPQSNAIHVAHNIPTGSDITVKQTKPYNTSVHISLNIAKDCKVRVEMRDVVNCALHVSVNNGAGGEVEVVVDRAFNSSVHLSFQNPVRMPVTLMMDSPQVTQVHVSQNVPKDSPVEIVLTNPNGCHIHASQSVPRSSPMTFAIEGENIDNQIAVSQSAADDKSPLTCTPQCPANDEPDHDEASDGEAQGFPQQPEQNDGKGGAVDNEITEFPDYNVELPSGNNKPAKIPKMLNNIDCPGETIEACMNLCPSSNIVVFQACVGVCGLRCA